MAFPRRDHDHVSGRQGYAEVSSDQPSVAGEWLNYLQKVVLHRLHLEAAQVMTLQNENAAGREIHLNRPERTRIKHAAASTKLPDLPRAFARPATTKS